MVLAGGAFSAPADEACPKQTGNRVHGVFIPNSASPQVKARLLRQAKANFAKLDKARLASCPKAKGGAIKVSPSPAVKAK